MKRTVVYTLLLMLALSGCGQQKETALPDTGNTLPQEEQTQQSASAAVNDRSPAAAELGRPEKTDLEFVVEGETEYLPAALYIGQGYSMYIPDTGWRLETDMDDGIPEDTWESTLNDDVELTVSHYSGVSEHEARTRFAADQDGYIFEDLMGGGWGDPLMGMEADGDRVAFMSTEGNGTVYVVSWKYPAEAAEGFGVRLTQIAETFELMN